MSLRSIPLRLKLVMALVIPLVVVAVYLSFSVAESMGQRRIAAEQNDEVSRFEAVASLANAIGAENLALNDRTKSNADLATARLATDEATATLKRLREAGKIRVRGRAVSLSES